MVARAQTAEFTYKYANNLPDGHPLNARAKEMAAAIKAETNGKFDLQIFPNNQLGSDTDMLSQIRSGGIEFFTLSGLILATLVPAASISGIVSRSRTTTRSGRPWMAGWAPMSAARSPRPIWWSWTRSGKRVPPDHVVEQADQRPGRFKASRSGAGVPALDLDVQGVRCRARLDQFQRSVFCASDQDRRRPGKSAGDHLDRQTLRSAKILLADQPHVGRVLVPGQPPRLGKGAGRCPRRRRQDINAAGVKEREDVAKLNAGLQQELAGKGLAFNQPNVAPFRDKLRSAGFYSEWKGKYGDQAWELLEKSVGKLS